MSYILFFFSSRRRHTRWPRDWSSDVCSSDLAEGVAQSSCASCHGEDFSGGMGPALEGTSLSEEEFTDTVRNGQNSMPAFSEDQVSDEELTAMYDMWSE